MQNPPPVPDPRRFEVSRRTLLFDRLMGWVIRLGGIGVIVAVFGILYFVGKEVVPLFRGASVAEAGVAEAGMRPAVLGVDEWGERPFVYDGGKRLVLLRFTDDSREELLLPDLEGGEVTALSHDPVTQRVALGLADGRVGSFRVEYRRDATGVTASVISEPWFSLTKGEGPVTEVSYGDSGEGRVLVAKRGTGASSTVSILRFGMKRSLIGGAKLSLLEEIDINSQLGSEAVELRASPTGGLALVACADGGVRYFRVDSEGVSLRQVFRPFGGKPARRIDFLFGGVSVICTGPAGEQQQWSLFRENEDSERLFGRTKEFSEMSGDSAVFASSQRNRSFVSGAGRRLSLRHSTSGGERWQGEDPDAAVLAVYDAKGEHFLTASAAGSVRRHAVHDPHPEAGWRAFFGKVWYEGGSGPVHQWQSSGGSDDFEPKFSKTPLIFGSLKGTAYALLFSVPVALLAAVFSAAFLPAEVKRVVKPAMEIMSSLPSVVLGFLAGLWLAPLLETKVPSVLLCCILLPLGALAAGFLWCRLPIGFRNRFGGGHEWLLVVPFLIVAGAAGWLLGPVLESFVFVVKDPADPEGLRRVADFRLWWPQFTGLKFEQRNSMVLGFMMGFAVIPVIFTIAEDALSNVPKPLTAAAAALGANRWQVVRTVMLPVASSGIFSALMIGFGRAVGETMVMVMATGNTPVSEWNIFNGMRTLAANIAVELPEAPVGSTHYRALFLGAVVLFLMTFALNTVAELLRQRLRERNKIV
jgi:phosphate transport system permease protein